MPRWTMGWIRSGLPLLLAGACAAAVAATPAPQRHFEVRHFTGLTAKAITREDDATLDIDFDRLGGGLLRFAHCRELRPALLAQVVPAQAVLAETLRLNCLAVRRFDAARPAVRSQLPRRWSAATVAAMPAALLPVLAPVEGQTSAASAPSASAAAERPATLARRPGSRHIGLAADGAVRVSGSDVVALLHRLACADFDGDGSEDWLVRIDWAARHGDARGSELVLISRMAAGGRWRVIERVTR
jgi:hypothetical protein